MSFGITKTIPAKEGIERLNSLYDGSLAEYEFHMAGQPSKLKVGDYVYTIFNDQLQGRLKIKRLMGGAVNPQSGQPRTLIVMKDSPCTNQYFYSLSSSLMHLLSQEADWLSASPLLHLSTEIGESWTTKNYFRGQSAPS